MNAASGLKLVRAEPEFFECYRSLGGELSRGRYEAVAAKFIATTMEAYIDGVGDRDEAFNTFAEWLRGKYLAEKPWVIFRSIDMVHCYT